MLRKLHVSQMWKDRVDQGSVRHANWHWLEFRSISQSCAALYWRGRLRTHLGDQAPHSLMELRYWAAENVSCRLDVRTENDRTVPIMISGQGLPVLRRLEIYRIKKWKKQRRPTCSMTGDTKYELRRGWKCIWNEVETTELVFIISFFPLIHVKTDVPDLPMHSQF